jgi:hypothetical protein
LGTIQDVNKNISNWDGLDKAMQEASVRAKAKSMKGLTSNERSAIEAAIVKIPTDRDKLLAVQSEIQKKVPKMDQDVRTLRRLTLDHLSTPGIESCKNFKF